MTDDEFFLARDCYGYGHWAAPYWFIGLEEGQSKEGSDTLKVRAGVRRELGEDGLCDIRLFHNHAKIDEKWFKGSKPPTQSTWRYLILALKAYLNEDTELESIRLYQRDFWGSSDSKIGKTCLVEISGIAANSLNVPIVRETSRAVRIETIHKKLLANKPKFAIIYGKHQHEHWAEVARDVREKTHTNIEFAESPTAHTVKGQSKKVYWQELGKKLQTVK